MNINNENDRETQSVECENEGHLQKQSERDNNTTTRAQDIITKETSTKDIRDKTLEKQSENSYSAEVMLKSIYHDMDSSVSQSTIQVLTDGFMARFLPSLVKAQSSINQIKSSHLVLIETVQQESSKFSDCQAITELKETMVKAKLYHNKLLKLKREMTDLHEKSKRLKKRALKLQQQKQKEELTRAHNLEKEYEKERMLTARIASSSD